MPHALTELDDFTTPITVPDGTDSRSDAAEVVEGIAQALANRTKAINEHVAWFDAANTFTEPNTFEDNILAQDGVGVDSVGASAAALTVFTSPDDDPNPGNRWKKVIQALVGGELCDAMMWSGIPSHDGQLLFTINARWDAATQRWIQQTNTLHSFALILSYTGVSTFSRKDSGSGPWASWPVTGTTEVRAGTVTATDLVIGGGAISYATPRVRTTAIALSRFVGPDIFFSTFGQTGIALASTEIVVCDLRMRALAVLNQVQVLVEPAAAGIMTLRAHHRGTQDWTTPNQTAGTLVSSAPSDGTANKQVLTVDFGGLTVSEDEDYWITLQGGNANDKLYAARLVNWSDAGPRNN